MVNNNHSLVLSYCSVSIILLAQSFFYSYNTLLIIAVFANIFAVSALTVLGSKKYTLAELIIIIQLTLFVFAFSEYSTRAQDILVLIISGVPTFTLLLIAILIIKNPGEVTLNH